MFEKVAAYKISDGSVHKDMKEAIYNELVLIISKYADSLDNPQSVQLFEMFSPYKVTAYMIKNRKKIIDLLNEYPED